MQLLVTQVDPLGSLDARHKGDFATRWPLRLGWLEPDLPIEFGILLGNNFALQNDQTQSSGFSRRGTFSLQAVESLTDA